jgi:2-polyprenyl-3-methyl-5-hydroxy-6-metoxy-1,4-benzoquinol methylase
MQTAERVSGQDASDNYVFQRSKLAYAKAAELIQGKVLELGSGMGYGIEILAPHCSEYLAMDKHSPPIALESFSNLTFQQTTFPSIPASDHSFDFVVSFQVIEHIQDDHAFVKEVHRVLKPGGKFIVTTPNKPMSITRNPWHIREYNPLELEKLLSPHFPNIQKFGVFGRAKIMEYYEKNKASVKKITQFDLFNLQHRAPAWLLKIPYDLLNRLNRKALLKQNNTLVREISMEDYFIDAVNKHCFDLFYVAQKDSNPTPFG